MIQPLFIFQSTPKCPGCHNNENTKVVCRNCNHEYTNDITIIDIILVILLVLFICWSITTIFLWICPMRGWNNPSLFEVIKIQWTWISNKKII